VALRRRPRRLSVVPDDFEGERQLEQLGARQHDSFGSPVDAVAKQHGASVDKDTTDGGVAYASVPAREPTAYRYGWLPSMIWQS
jgi:hypothetical protein